MKIVRYGKRRGDESYGCLSLFAVNALDPISVSGLISRKNKIRIIGECDKTLGDSVELDGDIRKRIYLTFGYGTLQRIPKFMESLYRICESAFKFSLKSEEKLLVPVVSGIFPEKPAHAIHPDAVEHFVAHPVGVFDRLEQTGRNIDNIFQSVQRLNGRTRDFACETDDGRGGGRVAYRSALKLALKRGERSRCAGAFAAAFADKPVENTRQSLYRKLAA